MAPRPKKSRVRTHDKRHDPQCLHGQKCEVRTLFLTGPYPIFLLCKRAFSHGHTGVYLHLNCNELVSGRATICNTLMKKGSSFRNIGQNNVLWSSESKPRSLYFSKILFQGIIYGGDYIRRGLIYRLKFAIQNRLGWFKVGRKFMSYCVCFALFYFVFESNLQVCAPGGLYSLGRFNNGFLYVVCLGRLYLRGLMFWILRYIRI